MAHPKPGQGQAEPKSGTVSGCGLTDAQRNTKTVVEVRAENRGIIWRLMGCKSPKTGVIKSCNELSLETPLDAQKAERALAMLAQAGLLVFLQAWKGSEVLIFLSSVGKKNKPYPSRETGRTGS